MCEIRKFTGRQSDSSAIVMMIYRGEAWAQQGNETCETREREKLRPIVVAIKEKKRIQGGVQILEPLGVIVR